MIGLLKKWIKGLLDHWIAEDSPHPTTQSPSHLSTCALREGFSLLEVLVALVVFAVGVTGMLTALGYSLRDINYTKDHALAVRIASREMNTLRRTTYVPESESEGEEGRFSWQAVVETMDVDNMPGMDGDDESQSDALVPCKMEVTVVWSDNVDGGPTHKVKLNGIELFDDE